MESPCRLILLSSAANRFILEGIDFFSSMVPKGDWVWFLMSPMLGESPSPSEFLSNLSGLMLYPVRLAFELPCLDPSSNGSPLCLFSSSSPPISSSSSSSHLLTLKLISEILSSNSLVLNYRVYSNFFMIPSYLSYAITVVA